jgi:hypothetical protein
MLHWSHNCDAVSNNESLILSLKGDVEAPEDSYESSWQESLVGLVGPLLCWLSDEEGALTHGEVP